MLTSTRVITFLGTHALSQLPSWHECSRKHGHSWACAVTVSIPGAELAEGANLRLITAVGELERRLVHTHLNDEIPAGEEGLVDVRELAEFAQEFVAERLAGSAACAVTVWVRRSNSKAVARYPATADGDRLDPQGAPRELLDLAEPLLMDRELPPVQLAGAAG